MLVAEGAMIISMKRKASREDIEQVIQRIQDFGYKIHTIEGEERVVIGAIGVGDVTACLESLEAMPCVEKAVRISAPYKFVSKEFKPGKTIIQCGQGVEIGRRRVRRHGRSVLGGEREADHGDGRIGRAGRSQGAARRRVQAAHLALRFPGHGRRRPEAAGQGARADRTGDRHRGDERPRRVDWSPTTPTSCRSARATCRTSRC